MNKFWRFPFISSASLLGIALLFSLWSGSVAAIDGASPKVMVSGDSISAGFNQPSYRMHFYNSLIADDCPVDMVGDQEVTSFSLNTGAAGIDYPILAGVVDGHPAGSHWSKDNPDDDTDHQAYGGMRADQILNGGTFGGGARVLLPISDYAAIETPDYVLVHLGTNDLGQKITGSSPPDTPAEITQWANQTRNDMRGIIAALKAQNSDIKILVGNFIPRRGEVGDTTLVGGVEKQQLEVQMNDAYRESLTDEIDGMNDSNVQLVDVATGFNFVTMTSDNIHPNRAGEIAIANAFVAKFKEMGGCDNNTGGGNSEPEILSPEEGSSIDGSSVDVTWADNDKPGISRWWVRAGSDSSGTYDAANDYYNSGSIKIPSATSHTVTNLPQGGSTVYISLWYYADGVWTMAEINSYTSEGTNTGGSNVPEITSPAEPGPIDGTSVSVTWDSNGVPDIVRWWVRAGQNSDGSYDAVNDYYNSGSIFDPAATSVTVTNLPADGSTVYFSLWYYANGVWALADVGTYVNSDSGTGGGGSDTPEITSPTSPGTIDGASVQVSWDRNDVAGVSRWWVRAGSDSTGGYDAANDYHNSGSIFNSAATSWTVTGLPEDDSTVYISLWYFANNAWALADIKSYTNADDGVAGGGVSSTPEITSPLPPESIEGSQVTITWDRNDSSNVSRWWVRAGTNPFGEYQPDVDYHNSGHLDKGLNSHTISGLPADGSTVYISLWYLVDDVWERAPIVEFSNTP